MVDMIMMTLKNKNGRKILIMTAQNCKLNGNGMIRFPKIFNGFTVKLSAYNRPGFDRLNQIRFLPRQGKIVMEIVYSMILADVRNHSSSYLSIDIGVDNLAAVSNNFGKRPMIVNGKPLKSVNQLKIKYKRAQNSSC